MSWGAISISRREMEDELGRSDPQLVLLGLVGLGVVVIWITEALKWPWELDLLGLALMALALLVRLLWERRKRTALWLLVLGAMAASLLLLDWFPADGTACLFAVPTGLAALLIGPRSGFVVAGLSSLVLLGAGGMLPVEAPPSAAAIAVIWSMDALLSLSRRASGELIEVLSSRYDEMQQLLEEARAQRVELRQTQDDLIQANNQMERLSGRLESMYRLAEEARRVKEQFVANVSHELRTPLNMIVGFSEMIAQAPHAYGVELPPRLLADVAVIQRNAQHLASLVDDVLDLSRVEAGQMAVSREWVSLRDIVEAAVVAVRPLFESKGLRLVIDVPSDVPPLFCDRTRIRQVVLNLLSNAGRFTDDGGAQVEVRVAGNDVVVSVSDSGPGISPETREWIFEPFHQADDSIRRRYGGTGLGLAISKRFIEMHGGRMWLDSEPGRGSAFHFSLPIEVAPPRGPDSTRRWLTANPYYEPRSRRSRAPAPSLLQRFVVVESGNLLQRLIRRYLGAVEVVSVPDLEQAIGELRREPARALIVNDRAIHTAKSHAAWAIGVPCQTPIITCWVPGEAEAAERLGVVRYLVKPVSTEALLSTIDGLGCSVRTVLVADDEQEALQLFGRMLASAGRGYRVLRAPNGPRALSLLRERRPDVMLLDLRMPGMNGYMVLQEKSSDPRIRGIPVVAISAQDPVAEAAGSDFLTCTQSGGLTLREVLACVQTLSEVLAPRDRSGDQERPASPVC